MEYDSEDSKKKRARMPNYSNEEKMTLLNFVNSYKSVIESKKTDQVTSKDKDRIWEVITSKFNSVAPNKVWRSKESLRKYYENIKKTVRRDAAETRKEYFKTGGGTQVPVTNNGEVFDMAKSIINKKTVFGLGNIYDSDKMSDQNDLPGPSSAPHVVIEVEQGLDSNLDDMQFLQHVEEPFEREERQEIVSPKKRKPAMQADGTPNNWVNRRRPAVPTSLPSSDIVKKYSDLADVKIEIAHIQKQTALLEKKERELKVAQIEELFLLQKQLLEAQIKNQIRQFR